LQHNETVNWFKQQGLTYNHNLVSSPAHFNINSLPAAIKKSHPNALFREHQEQDDINFELFLQEIEKQDQLKGISVGDYSDTLVSLFNSR
jgi:ABC-type branched-subunit amino acid transport system substrate-binding protein